MEPHPQVPSVTVAEGELHQHNLSERSVEDDHGCAHGSTASSWRRFDSTRQSYDPLSADVPHAHGMAVGSNGASSLYGSAATGGYGTNGEYDTLQAFRDRAHVKYPRTSTNVSSAVGVGSQRSVNATPPARKGVMARIFGSKDSSQGNSLPPSVNSSASSPPSPPPSPATPIPAPTGNFTRFYEHPTQQPATTPLPFQAPLGDQAPAAGGGRGALTLGELVYVLSSSVMDKL